MQFEAGLELMIFLAPIPQCWDYSLCTITPSFVFFNVKKINFKNALAHESHDVRFKNRLCMGGLRRAE
jgi:hypothetical protein